MTLQFCFLATQPSPPQVVLTSTSGQMVWLTIGHRLDRSLLYHDYRGGGSSTHFLVTGWAIQTAAGDPGPPRDYTASAVLGTNFYVYGGRTVCRVLFLWHYVVFFKKYSTCQYVCFQSIPCNFVEEFHASRRANSLKTSMFSVLVRPCSFQIELQWLSTRVIPSRNGSLDQA